MHQYYVLIQGIKCSFLFPLFLFVISYIIKICYFCFLLCFTVHEKSILLPLLPASLLAAEEPFLFSWLTQSALLSMFPLIVRDGLVVAYLASFALFVLVFNAPGRSKIKDSYYYFSSRIMRLTLCFCSFILHIVYLIMRPPNKYPFLFEALIMNLCFSQFVLVTLRTNLKQWVLDKPAKLEKIEKKLIWYLISSLIVSFSCWIVGSRGTRLIVFEHKLLTPFLWCFIIILLMCFCILVWLLLIYHFVLVCGIYIQVLIGPWKTQYESWNPPWF